MQEILQGYRLSPQQKHLWLLQQTGGSLPYIAQCAVLIEGELNTTALSAALQEVVDRNEILRTTFCCLPGMTIPVQVIGDKGLKIDRYNFSLDDPQQQSAQIDALIEQAGKTAFDFQQEPLFHTSLICLSKTSHMLIITLPALCADGIGLNNLVREISRCYSASVGGEALGDEPMQYADISEWQNELLEKQDAEIGRRYWQQKDYTALHSLKLPFGRQPSGQREYRPERSRLTIQPELVTKLDSLALALDTQTSVLLLACWNALLSRLTQQSRIIVGVGYDGRKYEGLEEAVGLFAKYLPVACNVEEESTFRRLVKEVEEAGNEAGKWQEYFNQEQISGGESGDNSRYIGIGYEYEEEATEQQAGGVRIKIYRQQTCTERFDLKLRCKRRGAEIEVEMGYDPAVYDRAEIERLTRQYEKLVSSMLEASDTPVSKLDLIPDEQLHQLLVEFNDSRREYPRAVCIHELFERQAERTPMATAVVYEQEEVTYRELNERANQLARYLQALGVGPEVLACIYMQRSIEMIVGLLAILKAGGAYVPLDSSYPKQRLAFMLADTQAAVLLTHQGLESELPDHKVEIVRVDAQWEAIAEESKANVESSVGIDNRVYVIYTSGTTGKPKGVIIEHKSVHNFLCWKQEMYELTPADRVLVKSPLNFDPSVWEIFWPLMVGASLIVARPEGHKDGEYLIELITEKEVTIAHFVPSMAAIFLESEGVERCKTLKRMVCGGEALPPAIVKKFSERVGGELHNSYGPTETTIAALDWTCEQASQRLTVPIGRPLANTQIYLLDKEMKPVPIGVAGELCVGGESLGRGYLNRPELTAEKFVPDEYSGKAGAKLYRTGDLARYDEKGVLEFLGRIDHQVKIRGNRVELGEIEAVLGEHEGVQDALVVAREEKSGEKRLVGYVVAKAGVESGKLKSYMRERMPEYMVPSWIVMMDAMPLAVNGKIDHKALPEPEPARGEEWSYAAPRTAVEELLAGIWEELLGVSRVGVHDNFFDLGGHSLLATQMASRVREVLEVELGLREYFDTPTVAGLAEKIEQARGVGNFAQAPGITRMPRDGQIPLSYAQQRIWFLDRLQPGMTAYNVPAAVSLTGPLNVTALERSFNEIIRRHETLRTSFPIVNGEMSQVIAPATAFELTVMDLQEFPDDQRKAEALRIAEAEAQRTFDLQHDRLLRTKLLRLSEQEHLLILTTHHIVSDGWSRDLLIRELSALYQAFSSGKPSPLPELEIQYADFAVWQREWLQGEVLDAQLSYWKQMLSGIPVLELPTDRPRPAVQTFRGARESVLIPGSQSNALKALSRREGATLYMVLLAAFKLILHRYSDQDHISVGTPIAGRNRTEIENLIGFFVNTLVLRTDMSGDPSYKELLGRVREIALGAYEHQDVPFEMLVEQLQPERSLSHTPLFQVMFVLQNASKDSLEVPGLELKSLGLEDTPAQFELTLTVIELEDGLIANWDYNVDLFDADTIKRMAEHFKISLEAMASDPSKRISTLTLLSDAERHQLLAEWNDTYSDYQLDKYIHQLFEEQAEKTPDALALMFKDEQVTYGDLNSRANQLAHYLRAKGVGPDVLVGICIDRSIEMVVGLLGIIKAGGAYVPLDPSYPKARLEFMLEDLGSIVALTGSKFANLLPEDKVELICLDSDWELISGSSTDNCPTEITGGNLAYVIYTSGSTGTPKGAMNTHKGILNRLLWMQDEYRLSQDDRVLQKTPYSFDVSVWEFFWPLMTGAGLVVAEPGGHQNSSYLVELIAKQKVTVAHFVPSMLQVFLQEQAVETCESLRAVICSGEALPTELESAFYDKLNAELNNLYGPTEAAVDVTYWKCERESERLNVPIGKPIANTNLYVLDRYQQPAPIGIAGELHIGGIGLARGYLNRPELTAEKFIPNPFLSADKERLYKTGDLARYLPDGVIEFLGRIDHQVKIRGFRIELGEIEAALNQHESVFESVVIAHENASLDKRLVAYVVINGDQTLTISQMRSYLKEKLPEYMIPSALIILEALPLNSNGKLDRRALPAPDSVRPELESAFVAPETETEQIIAAIWQEELQREKVGIHDNFFDLGGHSLLMVKVNNRLAEAFNREINLADMFRYPTISALTEHLNNKAQEEPSFEQSQERATTRKQATNRQRQIRQERRTAKQG